ncbi:MAG: hypothetical protein A3D33_06010 [Candidatus Rokubacteria bacterium RIFCSPHIGHO2_02_FULL_73_26]|nr:MAG: hypothetical protein A3D33_06010 [Candidatus Rokubacteria bacterium RIFCSPHIGHO2_02_FULL_73_26]
MKPVAESAITLGSLTRGRGATAPAAKNSRNARCTARVTARWRARNRRAASAGGPGTPTRRASRPTSRASSGSVCVWNSCRICRRCSTVRRWTYAWESIRPRSGAR